MVDILVCKSDEIADRGRKVVQIGALEVGIFNLRGKLFAYENVCPHFAGPACQGVIAPRFAEGVCEDRTSVGRVFDRDGRMNIVCPWHGYEFDIETGSHPTDARMRLKPVPVSVRDGGVYLSVPERRI
ncbi:MAG: Rieske (2Fe-2S) protein [Beijerinckiaceae bacterium]